MLQFIITEQGDGRYFGRIAGDEAQEIWEETGDDIDCCLNTPEDCLKCLRDQYTIYKLKEIKTKKGYLE